MYTRIIFFGVGADFNKALQKLCGPINTLTDGHFEVLDLDDARAGDLWAKLRQQPWVVPFHTAYFPEQDIIKGPLWQEEQNCIAAGPKLSAIPANMVAHE